MRKISIALILILYTLCAGAQHLSELKNQIQTELKNEKLTGAVWSIVDSNGTINTDAAGIKNTDTGEPLLATNKVHVGSIAKTVLAAGVLHLATIGKINLDAPLNHYLPDVKFQNKWEATNPVTIRHLLNHTSGLGDIRLWHFFSNTASSTTPLYEFYKRQPDLLLIQQKPGAWFSYSNMGYTLLGMLIEKISLKSYEHFLDTELLKPLGMLQSTFAFVSQSGSNKDAQLAMGHLENWKPFPAYPIYVRPSGQFTTTANDMALFLKFLMSNGKVNDRLLIDSVYLSEMGYAQNTIAKKCGLPFGYTYGILRRDKNGVLSFFNNGNIVGYFANIYFFPETKQAFFIAFNTDSETADYGKFDALIIRHLGIEAKKSAHEAKPVTGFDAWNGYYVPLMTKYTPFGLFDRMFSFEKVTVYKDKIQITPFAGKTRELFYTGNHLFIDGDKTMISHAFIKDEEKRQIITDGRKNLQKINGLNILCLWFSFSCGVLGALYIFIAGIVRLVKYRFKISDAAYFPVFAGISMVIASSGFAFTRPFNEIANRSLPNVLLAVATGLLPLLILFCLWRLFSIYKVKAICNLIGIACILLLQLVIVMFANGLLPLMMWR